MRIAIHAALILALTLLTQVGALIYAAALGTRRYAPFARTPAGFALLFVALYAASWWPIERIAAVSGRASLPCIERAGLSSSAFSCVLHRHYADARLVSIASRLANDMDRRFPGTITRTLDGSFPFIDGLPLPPHLSHDDGEKLDLAFYYRRNGEYRPGALASPIGYWRFEQPASGEAQPCGGASTGLRWNMAWFAPFTADDLELNAGRTRYALRWLASSGAQEGVGKVFVEPHLAQRLNVHGEVIRFQGCRAARHDDHIHVQLR
ncbi:hypothetical protein [Terricaulis silvestris]|uniref:Uncharacterized protein n=1 Tax=Terricaulis silvestris TaxID=2686094 RepID=A0A6I6MN22_9CAUL|nr:hypothetical protein [Terricaulis silvestris]QGZ94344.1 hypothetical protein DSM104635_01162 [Terricaulis silvestris]